jgi:hypothetical protein
VSLVRGWQEVGGTRGVGQGAGEDSVSLAADRAMMRWMRSLFAVSGVVFFACASTPPSSVPPPAEPGASSTAASGSESAVADPAPAPHFRPLDLTSACPHDVHLYFGEHPGDGKGQPGVVTSDATIPVPRGADGTTTVWVVDNTGAGLASVQITRPMRHVRIDAACMKIEADSTR